ncbi:recombinase family protein [Dactylosporangium siamense]|uniref:Serine recombinase n=1 Tax=Dactylosporangium siamense TaxID=685454 RepID=A0A919PIU7_9ACTN|nr:recombinase family protein [Dactylosporangium siamense]GIG42998.1 serine recombinase [Dactylosporangium siamense]
MTSANAPMDLYLRLSDLRTEDLNEDGLSKGLVEHERLLRERAKREGWTIGKPVIENDMKGGKPKPASAFKRRKVTLADGTTALRVIRPGFDELLDRIRSGKSGGFLCVDLDRAVRNPRDLEDLIDTVEAHSANVKSLTGTLSFTNGGTPDERTIARMMVTMANKSSTDTARRVAAARLRQAMNGEHGGGPRPYGFEPDGITIRENEAGEIVKMAEQVLNEVPLRVIVRDLIKREVARERPWSARTVRLILLRPRNAGLMVHRGEKVGAAPWKPILDRDVWESVVAVLEDPARRSGPGPAHRWLGSFLYKCACDSPMRPGNPGKSIKKRGAPPGPAYLCSTRGPGGPHTSRQCDILDGYITDFIIRWAQRPGAINLLRTTDPGIDVPALREKEAALIEKLAQYTRDEAADLITRAQMLEGTKVTRARLDAVQQQLGSVVVESPVKQLVEAEDKRAKWESMSLGIQRAILSELLEVTVLPAPRGPGFKPEYVQIVEKL